MAEFAVNIYQSKTVNLSSPTKNLMTKIHEAITIPVISTRNTKN
jgi:hypothetical protein